MTRRMLVAALVCMMAIGLTGCGGDETSAIVQPTESAAAFEWGVLETPQGITPEEVALVKFARSVFANDFGLEDASLLDPSVASMNYRTAEAEELAAGGDSTYALATLRLKDGTIIELSRTRDTLGPESRWSTYYQYTNLALMDAWRDENGVATNPAPADTPDELVEDADRKEALLALGEEVALASGFEYDWVRGDFVAGAWNDIDGPPEAKELGSATYRASMIGLSYDAARPGYRGYLATAYNDLSLRPEGTVDIIVSYDTDWNIVNLRVNGPVE